MSFWDKVKDFTRPYADDEYDDYDDEVEGFEEEEDDFLSQKPTKQSEINLLYADFLRALNQLYSAVKKHPKLKEDRRSEIIIIIKAIKEAIDVAGIRVAKVDIK